MPSSISEIKPLTSLRMFAALLVFFHHYNSINASNVSYLSSRLILEGHIGVNLFFVLSGFLITLRYAEEIRTAKFSVYRYWIRRIARIWPLYFFVLLSAWLVRPPPVLLVNFTFAQGYFDALKFTGVPTGWTLSIEEAFYLLAPLFIGLTVNRQLSIPLVALRLLSLAVVAYTIGIVLTEPGRRYGFLASINQMSEYTIFGRLFDFAAGIFAANLYLRQGRPQRMHLYGLLLIGVLGIIGSALAMSYANDEAVVWIFNPPLAVAASALMLALTGESWVAKLLSNASFVYGGRNSYALYLIQLNPLLLGITITLLPHLDPIWLYLLFSIVSAGLYEIIERPMQKRLVMWLSGASLVHLSMLLGKRKTN